MSATGEQTIPLSVSGYKEISEKQIPIRTVGTPGEQSIPLAISGYLEIPAQAVPITVNGYREIDFQFIPLRLTLPPFRNRYLAVLLEYLESVGKVISIAYNAVKIIPGIRSAGASVGLSADGTTALSGTSREGVVYDYVGNDWVYRVDFTGTGSGQGFSLSGNGQRAMTGGFISGNIFRPTTIGEVLVFDVSSNPASQIGNTIRPLPVSLLYSSYFGFNSAMSGDGSTFVATLLQLYQGSGSDQVSLLTYSLSGDTWVQSKSPIIESFGVVVSYNELSLSSDASRLAAIKYDGSDTTIVIYNDAGNAWSSSAEITRPADSQFQSLSLSADGVILATSVRHSTGLVAIYFYHLVDGTWTLTRIFDQPADIPAAYNWAYSIAYSANANRLVAGAIDYTVDGANGAIYIHDGVANQ